MKYILSFCLLVLFQNQQISAQQTYTTLSAQQTYATLSAQQTYATLSGHMAFLKDSDLVTIICDLYGQPGFAGYQSRYTCRVVDHYFQFKLPVGDTPLRFTLLFREKNNQHNNINNYLHFRLADYYLEKGDHIVLYEKDGQETITGTGADKFNIIKELQQIEAQQLQGIHWGLPQDTKLYFEKQDSIALQKLDYLHSRKTSLGQDMYNLLKADALSSFYNKGNFLYVMPDSVKQLALNDLKTYRCLVDSGIINGKTLEQTTIIEYSGLYTNALITKYIFDSCYTTGRPLLVSNCYDYLVRRYKGVLKERVVTNLLYQYKDKQQDISYYIRETLMNAGNKDFKTILQKLASNRIRGAIAYNFSLEDIRGKVVTLSSCKGKVVVLDFWYTGCGNCIKLAPYLARVEQYFKGYPVVFCSICIDTDKNKWIESVNSGRYTSPQINNLYTDGKGLTHPVCTYYNIDAYPTLIIIDKQGRLLNNPVDPRMDDGKNLISIIKEEISHTSE